MPSILAIDTSTDACSVALMANGEIHDIVSLIPREHTQRLLPMVAQLLAEHQLTLKQLDAIAFGCGPGSFTGLRICLSTVQGLAYGADLPLIAVSSLEALAAGAMRQCAIATSELIVPVIDARMDEVYWCCYQRNEEQLQPLTEEQVTTPTDCVLALSDYVSDLTRIVAVGSGWHYAVLAESHALQSKLLKVDIKSYPSAQDVAQLALNQYQRGDLLHPIAAEPRYLRNEISWKKRQRIRQR